MQWTVHQQNGDVNSHGNVAPWNVRFRNNHSRSFINWEYAGPASRPTGLAATGWYSAHLHPRQERCGMANRMIEFAIRDNENVARNKQITPETTDPEPLWLLAWQARTADLRRMGAARSGGLPLAVTPLVRPFLFTVA